MGVWQQHLHGVQRLRKPCTRFQNLVPADTNLVFTR